jgi:hypothetical protein
VPGTGSDRDWQDLVELLDPKDLRSGGDPEALTLMLAGPLGRYGPDGCDNAAARVLGRRRALGGVTLEDAVDAVQSQQRILGERARGWLGDGRDELVVEFLTLVARWTGWLIVGLTAGYGEAGPGPERAGGEADLVRRLLLGPAGEDTADVERYGLDPHRDYHAFRARLSSHVDEDRLARHLRLEPAPGRRIGLMTVVDGEAWGFAASLPAGRAPISIGVATPRPLAELAEAFGQATRALRAALALDRREVVTLDDLGVLASLVADPDLGQLLAQRYVAPVRELGPTGVHILSTVECYLDSSSRLEIAARRLDVHANTVRYRLGRFEELTDCSLGEVRVLAEVWWALSWDRLCRGGESRRSRGARRTR